MGRLVGRSVGRFSHLNKGPYFLAPRNFLNLIIARGKKKPREAKVIVISLRRGRR